MNLCCKSPIGYFAFSPKGEIIYYELFKPAEAVKNFSEEIPARFLESASGKESAEAVKMIRKKLREYAISLGFAENDEKLNVFLRDFGAELSKKKLKGSINKDRLVVQALNSIDEILKTTNMLSERLYEWFILHYPESKVSKKNIAEEILKFGNRENFPDFKSSTGIGLDNNDELAIRELASLVEKLKQSRKSTEKYVEVTVKEIAPNCVSIMDPVLVARILSHAGSLEKLAKMSSSTIQLLGAEKALFRHLNKKGKSPKYGIIFMDARIQSSSNKGKAARIIASKMMQAARIDFYSGRFEPKLKEALEGELKL